jgi:NADH-ubiquinone oxidoreductase chain 1
MWVLLPLFFILLVSLLAETNRSPFDFIEGERELVSGFNVEYGRRLFALIFLGEYARIIFCCVVLNILFIGRFLNYFFYLKLIFLVGVII